MVALRKPLFETLAEAVLRWRDRIYAHSAFQQVAASFPLTRPIAQARAKALFDLCAGFVYSQVLYACVELELFDMLAAGPLPIGEIAARADLSEEAAERLLRAASALRLLKERSAGAFGLGELGAALRGNPSVYDMIRHHRMLYSDLADPVSLLKRPKGDTQLSAYWAYSDEKSGAAASREEVAAYSDLMASTQAFIADDILDVVNFNAFNRLLDVGGGVGAFAAAAARAAPELRGAVFDVPAVAAIAANRLAAADLNDRVRPIAGDFLNDPLPAGYDVMTLVRILHDHDDWAVERLLANCRRALAAGGTLIVAEPMARTTGAAAMGDAYFGMYLWAMGSGKPRTDRELTAFLRRAGFNDVRQMSTRRPILTRVLVAR